MKILVIEDESALRDTIVGSLRKEQFIVEEAGELTGALQKINDYDYDCVVLDIMLPDGSGLDILEELKKRHRMESVLIISAKDSLEDKIRGLDLGADDYLAKPFHLAELNARIKSILRRRYAGGDISVKVGNVTFWPDTRTLSIDGKELELNRKEFDLFYYFAVNPNRVLNKMALAESVWGDHIDQADSFDFIYSQVKNLRKKLKLAGADLEIKAVYGFGYKLTVD